MASLTEYYRIAGLTATLSGLGAALLPWFYARESELEFFNYFLWGHVFTVSGQTRPLSTVVYYFWPASPGLFSLPLFLTLCAGLISVAMNALALLGVRRGRPTSWLGADPTAAHAIAGVLALGTVISYTRIMQQGGLQLTVVVGPQLMMLSFVSSMISALLAKLAHWQALAQLRRTAPAVGRR